MTYSKHNHWGKAFCLSHISSSAYSSTQHRYVIWSQKHFTFFTNRPTVSPANNILPLICFNRHPFTDTYISIQNKLTMSSADILLTRASNGNFSVDLILLGTLLHIFHSYCLDRDTLSSDHTCRYCSHLHCHSVL